MRSWLCRDSFSTRRPRNTIGRITAGITNAVNPANCGLVTISIVVDPISMTRLRSDNDNVEPTTVCTSSVSAASRDTSSPERVRSKNA